MLNWRLIANWNGGTTGNRTPMKRSTISRPNHWSMAPMKRHCSGTWTHMMAWCHLVRPRWTWNDHSSSLLSSCFIIQCQNWPGVLWSFLLVMSRPRRESNPPRVRIERNFHHPGTPSSPKSNWQRDVDLNHDSRFWRPKCYHWHHPSKMAESEGFGPSEQLCVTQFLSREPL